MDAIQPGLKGGVDLTVGEEHTAPSVGSGAIHVLGTPVMINLMEAAALDAVEHLLPEGHQSLGIHLEVSHVAATPVGMKVRATAEVTAVEGNRVQFRAEAHDGIDPIGEGTHERVVVNVERFDKKVRTKAGET
jgi:predicted thioesterase